MRVLFSHWQFFLIFQFNVNAKSTATLSIGIGENGKCVFVCFCSTHMNWKCERFQHCESDAGHYGNFIMAQHGRMKQMIEKKNTTPYIQLMDWIESTFQWDLYFVLLWFLWFFFRHETFQSMCSHFNCAFLSTTATLWNQSLVEKSSQMQRKKIH